MNTKFRFFILATLIGGHFLSCNDTAKRTEKTEMGFLEKKTGEKIFAEHAFYQKRVEKEVVLFGLIKKAAVRLGPNTREMPFTFVTPEQSFSVYVTEKEKVLLEHFVDKTVKITGKIIDQSTEGFGMEIWIGFIEVYEGMQE